MERQKLLTEITMVTYPPGSKKGYSQRTREGEGGTRDRPTHMIRWKREGNGREAVNGS